MVRVAMASLNVEAGAFKVKGRNEAFSLLLSKPPVTVERGERMPKLWMLTTALRG
jgi:hypothetical protein